MYATLSIQKTYVTETDLIGNHELVSTFFIVPYSNIRPKITSHRKLKKLKKKKLS